MPRMVDGGIDRAPPRPANRGPGLAPADHAFLLALQQQTLSYFLENQVPSGLVLDRQSNHGPRRRRGLTSTAATGMGLIALALASAPPYELMTRREAITRTGAALRGCLERLPHDAGVVPHFVDSATGAVCGSDCFSTVETSWLLAGGLWAAAFLRDCELETLADSLYERVDWLHWTDPESGPNAGLLQHGKDRYGRFLPCCWDRINGETLLMYVLGAGAAEGRRLPAWCWQKLEPFYGTVAGLSFNNADLGLFVFQYGLDLLDLAAWRAPGGPDLDAEARIATYANRRACVDAAHDFATYRRYWGLSAGDGPGESAERDQYRSYAPSGPIDGTAHVTASAASIAHAPGFVLENLHEAEHERELTPRGRYGFSNINLDRQWVGRDVVGIDLGALVLALDNFLFDQRVQSVFEEVPCVRAGLARLGFVPSTSAVADRSSAPARRAA
jgi:hypothetical protein